MFSGGGVKSRQASKESGIEKYGWNGEIYGSVGSILEVPKAQRVNMHEFMKFIAYKRTESKLNNPTVKPKGK